MLETDRQPDQFRRDARGRLLLRRQLLVRRRRRMDDQRLGVAHVGEQREQLHAVDQRLRFRRSALDPEREHAAEPAAKVTDGIAVLRVLR